MKKRGRPRKVLSSLRGPHKYQWSKEQLEFLQANFKNLTNRQLASELRLTLTLVRMKCYEIGLKRMELEYWTPEQILFLRKNYRKVGDVELAEIFNVRFKKNKSWTKQHIEKKRGYLCLTRTNEEVDAIRQRNIETGRFAMCPVKRWNKTGRTPEGEIRYWKRSDGIGEFPVIKVKGQFVHWTRWAWVKEYGSVPKDKKVTFKDGNNRNLRPDNLELITAGELSGRNSIRSSKGLSDNYIAGVMSHRDPEMRKMLLEQPKLLDLKRKQLTLQRAINEQIGKKD